MLDALVAGYGSGSDSDEEGASDSESKKCKQLDVPKDEAKSTGNSTVNIQAQPQKKRLPPASAMMAATTSWARPDQFVEEREADKIGTKYNNVPPPVGVRAEDGIAGSDYIKPKIGASLDASKLYTGERVLAKGPGSAAAIPAAGKPALLVPPQLRGGRKNVSTEDLGAWTTEKRKKAAESKP
mmetsp:Transcript_15168/g.32367  ORF Transcript_15168/g.32367 Transcript_15168/m.32367 type:complete len:183 (-) Transcript_15168:119-667(-)